MDRIGAYAMIGEAPTYYLTSGGTSTLPGSGLGNKALVAKASWDSFTSASISTCRS